MQTIDQIKIQVWCLVLEKWEWMTFDSFVVDFFIYINNHRKLNFLFYNDFSNFNMYSSFKIFFLQLGAFNEIDWLF